MTGQTTETRPAVTQLERADHLRGDADAISALMNARALFLRLDGLRPRVDDAGGLEWGSLAEADPDAELVFLGLIGERGCFAAVPRTSEAMPVRAIVQLIANMSPDDFALYAMARSIVDWHARHRFCAVCGSRTSVTRGGWQRTCRDAECGACHFPRTDPVAIMTVERRGDDGERLVLLGRQPGWPDRLYSALAGFVEPGETIEEAVAREVMEEAGLPVTHVEYSSSQPWPFPSQLMIGCAAYTDEARIVVDKNELETARWFTVAEVREMLAEGPEARWFAPPPRSIARTLLTRWADAD